MSQEFDPYYRWLGIRDTERPPDHYRLLGLEPFEGQAEVIMEAADRQMLHLRRHQIGQYAELSQRLLNEIAAAKLCLLDEARKKAYDRQLLGRRYPVDDERAASQPPDGKAPTPNLATQATTGRPPRRKDSDATWPQSGEHAELAVTGRESKPALASKRPHLAHPNAQSIISIDTSPAHQTAAKRNRRTSKTNSVLPTALGKQRLPVAFVTAAVLSMFLAISAFLVPMVYGPHLAAIDLELPRDGETYVVTSGEVVTGRFPVRFGYYWGDKIRYQISFDKEANATIDRGTGELSWETDRTGLYKVTVIVTTKDSRRRDQRTFRVCVNPI